MEKITMIDLKGRLSRLGEDEMILDVRTPEEFGAGHVPGSRNVPVDLVATSVEDLRKYRRVYVHCKAGGRAGRAADALAALGLSNLICVSGSGMDDWIAAGFPVERA
jgi:rhodanese-related sulfurtransferase